MASGTKKKPVPPTSSKSPAQTAGLFTNHEETRRSTRDRRNTRSARELLGMSPAKPASASAASNTPVRSAASKRHVATTTEEASALEMDAASHDIRPSEGTRKDSDLPGRATASRRIDAKAQSTTAVPAGRVSSVVFPNRGKVETQEEASGTTTRGKGAPLIQEEQRGTTSASREVETTRIKGAVRTELAGGSSDVKRDDHEQDTESETEEAEVHIIPRILPPREKDTKKKPVQWLGTDEGKSGDESGQEAGDPIATQRLLEKEKSVQLSTESSDHQMALEALSQLAAGGREIVNGGTIMINGEEVEIVLRQIDEHENTTESEDQVGDRRTTDVIEWVVDSNSSTSAQPQSLGTRGVRRVSRTDSEEEMLVYVEPRSTRAKQTKTIVVSDNLKQLIDQLEPEDYYANHVEITYDTHGKKRGRCIHCAEVIENRHHFRRHILRHPHVSYKPWRCPVCDYRSSIRAQVVRHINIHSEVKPYTCSECGKGFNFKQKLQLHMKYHWDIRDFHCTECDLSFHEHKTLKNHMSKIHNVHKVPKKAFRPDRRSLTNEQRMMIQRTTDEASDEDPGEEVEARTLLKPTSRQTVVVMHPNGEHEVRYIEHEQPDDEQHMVVVESAEHQVVEERPNAEETVAVEESTEAEIEQPHQVEIELTTADVPEDVDQTDMPMQIRISGIRPPKADESKVAEVSQVGEDGRGTEAAKKETSAPIAKESLRSRGIFVSKRKSNCYGTRKTEMYTEQYKKGLVGVANRNDAPPQRQFKAPSEETEEQTQSQGQEEEDAECEDGIQVFTHTEGDVKPAKNVPRCYSDDQLDPDLKPYCKVIQHGVTKAMFYCQVEACLTEELSFTSKTAFIQHLEAVHTDIKAWQCSFCDYRCRLRSSIIAHEQLHTGQKNYTCSICNRSFLFKQKLNNHMKHHLNLREFQCELCFKAFNEKAEMNRHMKRVHSTELEVKCPVCDKVVKDSVGLRRHMEVHDEAGKYECSVCKKYYKSRGSLAQHMKGHTCMFRCEICDKSFGSYSGFMAHKMMHDESYSGFSCQLCQKVLHTKGSLTRHMLVFHSDNRPFKCDRCSKTFKTKKDLKNHDIVHNDTRFFKCGTCSFQCKRIESLKVHMRRHSEIKPFQCGKCGKEYTQKRALEQHMRHHTNTEFPNYITTRQGLETVATVAGDGGGDGREKALTVFMCEECNSVFLNQDTLAVHILAEHMPKENTLSAEQIKGSMFEQQVPDGTIRVAQESEEQQEERFVPISAPSSGGKRRFVSLLVPQGTERPHSVTRRDVEEGVDVDDKELTSEATAMISGMDSADEQYVAVTDPATNQEVMVPVSHTNLGPFESLLAATEAADTHSEENAEGVSYVTFSADGTPMEYEDSSTANVIAITEESVVETVEIPIQED